MPKFVCNKLSRDKTLENMHSEGISTTHSMLSGQRLYDELNKKLLEETNEVIDARERSDIISELADVLEVIDGICAAHKITRDEIDVVKNAIAQKRGGFKTGLFVEVIAMDEGNPRVAHFRKSPEKYPEL